MRKREARCVGRLALASSNAAARILGRWRRQLHLLIAFQWMEKGAKVQDIAGNLGYENASNLVVMSYKALGQTPGLYLE